MTVFKNKRKADIAWEVMESLAASHGFYAEALMPWHLRIKMNGKILDYWPTRDKAMWLHTKRPFFLSLSKLESLIENEAKTKKP